MRAMNGIPFATADPSSPVLREHRERRRRPRPFTERAAPSAPSEGPVCVCLVRARVSASAHECKGDEPRHRGSVGSAERGRGREHGEKDMCSAHSGRRGEYVDRVNVLGEFLVAHHFNVIAGNEMALPVFTLLHNLLSRFRI